MAAPDPLTQLLVEGPEVEAVWKISQVLKGLTVDQKRSVLVQAATHYKLIAPCLHPRCFNPRVNKKHCALCNEWVNSDPTSACPCGVNRPHLTDD